MALNHITRSSELTERHFSAIGRVVVEWANLEYLQRSILARLLITPEFLSRTYTDEMSAARVQAAIAEAIDLHRRRYRFQLIDEASIDELDRINDRITKLRATRNKFAHFCWGRISDEEIFGTNFSGGHFGSRKDTRSNITMKVSELDAFHREMFTLVDRLSEILGKLPKVCEKEMMKRQPNQALQTTSVTRSGFGKVSVSDRQRRGV